MGSEEGQELCFSHVRFSMLVRPQCGDAGLAFGYKSQEFLGNLHSGVISIYVDLVEVTQGDCVGRGEAQNNPGAHQHFEDPHQHM